MSDMKTIMENFRQFERNDMENKIEKLLKENKNLKKRLNKTRKIKEGVMAGVNGLEDRRREICKRRPVGHRETASENMGKYTM